jgi:hypothetical protein
VTGSAILGNQGLGAIDLGLILVFALAHARDREKEDQDKRADGSQYEYDE